MTKITPIILSGGSGTRLWPLSRSLNPKQFLNIFGKKSLFLQTANRVKGEDFNNPVIICNDDHRFLAASQLQEEGLSADSIILEPIGRNTAPAIAVAAFDVLSRQGEENDIMLVMPSDHVIKDSDLFAKTVKKAANLAQKYLITFGIVAKSPHTGYGYIKKDSQIENSEAFIVDKFVEKPNKELAEKFVASSEYFWNSGIFMFKASKYLEELKKLKPEIHENALKSYQESKKDLDFTRLDKKHFEKCEDISIDYAVMENLSKSSKVAVLGLDVGWDDVGNFDAVSKNQETDENGNNNIGDIISRDTKNCYINSQHGLIATIGIEDLIVVNSKDVVLVANKNNSQDVKKIYQELKKQNRSECQTHVKTLRPWGSYEVLDDCTGFKVKRIIVKSNSSLSLQMHHKRAEHWIVVKGRAWVISGKKEFELKKGESTFIPKEQKHRLENKYEEDLEIIEVQTGSYLGEDDIVRFEDIYGR